MAKDFIFTDDLVIENGDFKVAESTEQHISHVLKARPGDYKNAPLIGIGIEDYLNAPTTPQLLRALERKIALHLQADGAKNINVNIGQSLLESKVSARYE